MLPEWGQAGFMILLAPIFPIGGIGSSWLLGVLGVRPQHADKVKEATYECGVEPEGPTWVQFTFRHYYRALQVGTFQLESVSLYPWAGARAQGWVTLFTQPLTLQGSNLPFSISLCCAGRQLKRPAPIITTSWLHGTRKPPPKRSARTPLVAVFVHIFTMSVNW